MTAGGGCRTMAADAACCGLHSAWTRPVVSQLLHARCWHGYCRVVPPFIHTACLSRLLAHSSLLPLLFVCPSFSSLVAASLFPNQPNTHKNNQSSHLGLPLLLFPRRC